MSRSNSKRLTIGDTKPRLTINRQSMKENQRRSELSQGKFLPIMKTPIKETQNPNNKSSELSCQSEELGDKIMIHHPEFYNTDQVVRRQNRTLSGFFTRQKKQNRSGPKRNSSQDKMLMISQIQKRNTLSAKENRKSLDISLHSIIEELIKSLTNSFFITRKNSSLYTVKKDKLDSILTFLFQILTTKNTAFIMSNYPEFKFLSSLISHIQAFKRSPFDNIDLSNTNLNVQIQKLGQILKRRQIVDEELTHLQRQTEKYKKKLEQLTRKEQELQSLNNSLREAKERKQYLQKQLQQALNSNGFYISAQKKLNNYNFKDQNRHIYEKKCKEFKDNETYMIEYGTYLNTHKLAVSLDNENTSFQEKEGMINEKKDEIMKILENRKHIGQEVFKIKFFIIDLATVYKQKIEDLQKLCYVKTHCIRSFIRNVKLWLKNWEFKQDVLSDLKKLFVISSFKLRSKIDEFKSKLKEKSEEEPSFFVYLTQISELFEEMVEYFKTGNSFY